MTVMDFVVRRATPEDGPALFELLPRLADFPKPGYRSDAEIYESDGKILRRWIEGGAPDCHVLLAEEAAGAPLGFALVTLGPEVLSGEPSAHLETLVVAAGARGGGVGSALLRAVDELARGAGARTITLHVFETNELARKLYERKGYAAEWIRYIKFL